MPCDFVYFNCGSPENQEFPAHFANLHGKSRSSATVTANGALLPRSTLVEIVRDCLPGVLVLRAIRWHGEGFHEPPALDQIGKHF
jgi:hypothetical protein